MRHTPIWAEPHLGDAAFFVGKLQMFAQALYRGTLGHSQYVDDASASVAGMDCNAVAASAVN